MSNTKDWRTDSKAKRKLRLTWRNMKHRCLNPNDKWYHRYGGRGIQICEEWLDFDVFMQWAYESGYDPYAEFMKCTLDRIDNDKDYCPENCRWTSMKAQTKNTSLNHFLTYKGITHCIVKWVEITGGKATSIYKRYELGKRPEEVLYPGRLSDHPTKGEMEAAIDEILARRLMEAEAL